MNDKFSEDELREKLDPQQYIVTQQAGTEPAFSGKYWNEKADGVYHCVVCDVALFSSETKFESGSGWPSFYQPLSEGALVRHEDKSHGMLRTEVRCGNCDAHLGHVFDDGPNPSGERHCINSAALNLNEND